MPKTRSLFVYTILLRDCYLDLMKSTQRTDKSVQNPSSLSNSNSEEAAHFLWLQTWVILIHSDDFYLRKPNTQR